MKGILIAVFVAIVVSTGGLALSQEIATGETAGEAEYDTSGQADAGPVASVYAPQPAASDSAPVMGYPAVSLGIKTELFSLQIVGLGIPAGGFTGMSHPVLAEFALRLHERVGLFLATGTYLYFEKSDNGSEQIDRVGVLLIQGGVRFNLMPPRPEHAHLYLAADFTGAIGFAVSELDGEADEDFEDIVREEVDHLFTGVAFGIEYLVSEEFGIAAEFATRLMVNDLKDTDDNLDKYYTGSLFSALGLRLSYHF